MAYAAFDAFFPVGVPGFAISIHFQRTEIDGGAEGHAPAAPMAKAGLLHFLDQVGKGFH